MKKFPLQVDFFKNLRTMDDLDNFEILFMRAEGIYAHGYHSHACKMAVSLAQDLLRCPPDLTQLTNVATEATGAKGKKLKNIDKYYYFLIYGIDQLKLKQVLCKSYTSRMQVMCKLYASYLQFLC